MGSSFASHATKTNTNGRRLAGGLILALSASAAACGTDVIVFESGGTNAGGSTTVTTGVATGGNATTTTSVGGAGGMATTSTGVGGGPECTDPNECPEPANECVLATCNGGSCDTELAPDGSPCLTGTCLGGVCTGGPGFPCQNAGECAGLACVDGVCCTSACDGTCEACDVSGSEGQCSVLEPGGLDPATCAGVCEGGGTCATGNIEAVYQSIQGGTQALLSVAIDNGGDVIAGGLFFGSWSFANTTYSAGGNQNGMWARFDSALNPVAFEQYGTSGFARVSAVAVNSQNQIHTGGWFGTNIVLDGANVDTSGGVDGYILRSAADGTGIDGVLVGNGGNQRIRGVATTSSDNLVLVGNSNDDDASINGLTVQNQGGFDGFVAVTDSGGTPQWALNVGDDDQSQRLYGVAVDAADNIIIAGRHRGSVTFAGLAPLVSPDERTALVAKISPSGTPLWSKQFGVTGNQLIWSTAVDAQNNIGLGGFTSGPVDFGGGIHSVIGQRSCMVAKLNANGDYIWSHTFGEGLVNNDAAGCQVFGIAFDPKGNLIAVGFVDGTLDIGLGPLPNDGTNQLSSFVAKFGPGGEPLWARRFNGNADQELLKVAVDGAGSIYTVGMLRGTAAYDGVRTAADGFPEALLIKLAP